MFLKRFGFILAIFALLAQSIALQANAAVPSVPTNVGARVGTTQAYGNGTVTVTWTKVSGATAYTARLTKSSDNSTLVQSVTGETNNEIVFNGLLGGSTYVVQVRAIQVTDVSDWSANSLTAVPKTAPKAPAKPTAIAGIGKATVSWVKVAAADTGGLDVTGYVIREINTATSNTVAADLSSYEYIGLTAGSTAEFTVTSINAANTSGTTSEKSDAVTIPAVANVMNTPTISGTGTAGEAQVNWVPPSNNGGSSLVSFTIKLIKNGADLLSRVVTDLTQTFEVFSSLATGTYTAKIASTNGVGISPYSLESGSLSVTAAPVATVAPTPSASASPSPTASAPSGGGGGFGGGGFGGGGGGGGFIPPAPIASLTPSSSPSVTATPTKSASPTPTAISSAKPSPSPSPSSSPSITPSPSASSSPSPTLTVLKNAKGEVTKTDTFAVPQKVSGPVKSSVITASKTAITTTLRTAIQPAVTVKKGSVIKVVVKDASGKSYTVASTKAKSAGVYKAPAIKFSKIGTYQVTILVGTVKKVITYKITK
ncbi:Fibronectin type III [Candidatus Nanopelagicaceae bacterium]